LKKPYVFLIFLGVITFSNVSAQQQFEFCNNFIQNLSFITGVDEGIERNLDDNFGWMNQQGYTHLRFFGIFANGYHAFPSPTLNANGYPTDPYREAILEILVNKANQYNIVVNFDGWEVIAESNQDTTQSGFEYLTEEEVAAVVQEVLSLGVTLITEEQFGGSYLQAIQSIVSEMGATHETTAGVWWPNTTIADEQLGSVFSFYHYNQAEVNSLGASATNLGFLHVWAEGAPYYDIPFSIAVGSFGTLETENWKNVLLFAQIQHLPERFSIEEDNTDFTIWDPTFNFMDYVGTEILSFAGQSFGERPIVNLVYDSSPLHSGPFRPAVDALYVNNPAIVNTFTLLGYRVIATVDSILPDADFYYLLVAGGANPYDIAPLPEYVLTLLDGDATVFLHPAFGIPDENDATDWVPVRELFGLPSGDTQTLMNLIPESVVFDEFTVLWGGVNLCITPRIEYLLSSQIDTTDTSVVLLGEVYGEDIALIIQNENKFLINSNVIHLEASYILSELIYGPLNAPAMADVAIVDDKALIFAEYDTDIDVELPWAGMTRVIRYDPQGNKILEANTDLGGNFSETLIRGEMVILMDTSTVSIPEHKPANDKLPVSFSLFQNYPNPFNSETTIKLELSEPATFKLVIYNINGELIRSLVNKHKNAGYYTVRWNGMDSKGKSAASGIYFCKLQVMTQDKTVYNKVVKMILTR